MRTPRGTTDCWGDGRRCVVEGDAKLMLALNWRVGGSTQQSQRTKITRPSWSRRARRGLRATKQTTCFASRSSSTRRMQTSTL